MLVTLMSSKEEPNNTDALKGIRNSIHETVKDQDFQQKINVYITLVMSYTRV